MICFRDGAFHFDINRCCQCGTCFAACGCSALFAALRPDGLHEIKQDQTKCRGCGLCAKVCPAHRLPDHPFTESDWAGFQALYLGRSADRNIAAAASSGGVARTLVTAAVQLSVCQKAYCLVTTDRYPWAEGKSLEGGFDPSSIANSMYLPILVNANLNKAGQGESLVVIGTNCQLLGVENLFPGSQSEITKIALLCKQQKTYEFTKFVGRRLGEKVGMNTPVRYRGGGWPGCTRVGKKKMSYADAVALPFGKKLWMVPGCRFCGNPFGYNADITLSDPWGVSSETECGETLIWVRSAKGVKFLESCRKALVLEKMDHDSAQAQKLVGWASYRRKQRLIPYYLGEQLPFRIKTVAKLAGLQRRVYEGLLSRVPLPDIAVRVISRLPFAEELL